MVVGSASGATCGGASGSASGSAFGSASGLRFARMGKGNGLSWECERDELSCVRCAGFGYWQVTDIGEDRWRRGWNKKGILTGKKFNR